MAFKQSLNLGLGQHLTMTPALQQAIRLLQLSTLDLKQEITEALESNMMLERPDDGLDSTPGDEDESSEFATENKDSDDIPEELPVDAEWDDVFDMPSTAGKNGPDQEAIDFRQASMHNEPSLREHLQWQADVHGFTAEEKEIAANIIDAINDDGYLVDWPSIDTRLQEIDGLNGDNIQKTLKAIQDFDPPGIAARNPAECLSIQLRQLPANMRGCVDALLIIENGLLHFLAEKKLGAIKQQLDIEDDQLESAIQLIQSLNPRPGSSYANTDSSYVVPEVFVTKRQSRWIVSLNPEIAPKLRINNYYQGLIKRADQSKEQQTLKNHLQEARYFLNSLKSRNETLLRVAQSIVEEQRAFMDYGDEAMKPMILRDIAERLGMHESTVSRATAHKYMHTPRGLFELKYFFSSHVSTTSGGTCSATAIQAMIKRHINNEASGKPLSDSRLAQLLLDEGVQVARRTVAKYREAMNIPPSHERKRLA